MAGKPIATVGSLQVCPMTTGTTPHVGGPIAGPGIPGIFIDGQPVAVLGDMCTCVGPPSTIATGCPGVLADGKPVAWVGSMTSHGGQVTVGVAGVTISSAAMKPATLPLSKIPFPKKLNSAAKKKVEEVKSVVEQEDDKEPRIFNLQWKREDIVINEGEIDSKVIVSADTWGFNDGETVTFTIYLPNEKEGQEDVLEKVFGIVKDNYVEAVWHIDKNKLKDTSNGKRA